MATGTRLMQEISDQFLNCKICGANFKDPKTLSCLHTFCQACLQDRYDTESTTRSGRYSIYLRHVTCPMCQKKTELPSGGVRRLPDNFLVSNLTDVLAKRTVASVPPCEICSTVKEKTVNASSKCLDCSKLLCSSCVNLHRTTKVTHHHSLIDLEGEKNIQCKVHEEEQLRYYCSPCDACICVVCAFQEHKDHDVCCFNEVSDKHRVHLQALLSQCQGRLQEVTSKLDNIQKQETAVKSAKEKIRDMAIDYISQVRTKERELMKQLDELCEGDIHSISEGRTTLQEYRSDLENSCCLTEVMLRERGVELLLIKGEIESKMNGLLRPNLCEPSTSVDLSDLRFVPGEVALGDISLQNELAESGDQNINLNNNQTPVTSTPDIINSPTIESTETCTTMAKDMRTQQSPSCIITKVVETSNRGISSTLDAMRARSTMTEPNDVRSFKCQTDPTSILDSIQHVHTNQQNDPQQAPDLLPTTPHLYTPGRRIWSRRVQTDISSLSLDGLRGLSNEDFIKLMTLTQNKVDDVPSVRRSRRVRTKEFGTVTDPVEHAQEVPKIEMTSTSSQCEDHPTVVTTDQETCTPTVCLETRGVWTDQVSTCDRACDAIHVKRYDRAVGTVAIRKENSGQQASPQMNTVTTNTPVTVATCIETQTEVSEQPRVNPNNIIIAEDVINMRHSKKHESNVKRKTSLITLCDRGSDVIFIHKPSKATGTHRVQMSTCATETTAIKLVDKDMVTAMVTTNDQWTETPMPQMVSTGVTPPRPLTQEIGVATIFVLTNEEATCTELKSFKDSHTEMIVSVCDQETSTEKQLHHDAQTGMDVVSESEGCGTETVDINEEGSMTDFSALDTTEEEDITFHDTMETLEKPPSKPCLLCGHMASEDIQEKNISVKKNGRAPGEGANDIDSCKGSSRNSDVKVPLMTQDVGTMALSCITSKAQLQDMGVQTQNPQLYDKASATSLDWEHGDDFLTTPLGCEYIDAATSTDSLPYIGLLSEIDVDELFVVPEAAFELISDTESETDHRHVIMVDDETSTDHIQCVEEGTQTRELGYNVAVGDQLTDSMDRKGIGEVIKTLVHVSQNSTDKASTISFGQTSENNEHSLVESHIEKHLVSIGVNTVPKLTFDKETCTPFRHLFSKGTMTFYVSKMNKSTDTLGQRAGLDFGKCRTVDKITMTSRTERKDIGVETDSAKMDDRITECISKLRNVSQRLNSPTTKKGTDGDAFFGDCFNSAKSGAILQQQSSNVHSVNATTGQQETDRQTQVRNLLEQSVEKKTKSKERKPQPITTLKGRRPVQPGQKSPGQVRVSEPPLECTSETCADSRDRTQSLPRRFPGERSGVVKMGSQPLPASRLPLLRYNSAPGRIAIVPNQPLITKSGSVSTSGDTPVSRPVSPSKIPVTKKKSPPELRANQTRADNYVEEKPQLRRPLPSITETRNSSCSDSSISSFASAPSTPTPSLTKKQVDDDRCSQMSAPDLIQSTPANAPNIGPENSQTLSTESAKTSSSHHSSTANSVSPAVSSSSLDTTRSSTDTLDGGKQEEKKEKRSFMSRFLSKKKKTPDTKKSDRKNPVCRPIISTSEVAATLANASLPPPAAPVDPHPQPHWPQLKLPPHHYPPPPEPKPPSPPRKSRPFVIVNQRVFSIQQDNVEVAVEKRRASLDHGVVVKLKENTSIDKKPAALHDQTSKQAKQCESKSVEGKQKRDTPHERVVEDEKVVPESTKSKTNESRQKKSSSKTELATTKSGSLEKPVKKGR